MSYVDFKKRCGSIFDFVARNNEKNDITPLMMQCKIAIFKMKQTLSDHKMYSDSQKHKSSCLLSDCFSCISPEPLELKKRYLHLFASLSKDLSDERRIFQFRTKKLRFSKYQLILCPALNNSSII